MRLVGLLRRIGGGLTAEGLMACIQILPEVGGYTSVHKTAAKESSWQREVMGRYGVEATRALQRYAPDPLEHKARCKRAAILRAWTDGEPMSAIEERYSVTPFQRNVGAGDITGFANRTRLYLRPAQGIVDVLLLGKGPDEESVDILTQHVEQQRAERLRCAAQVD